MAPCARRGNAAARSCAVTLVSLPQAGGLLQRIGVRGLPRLDRKRSDDGEEGKYCAVARTSAEPASSLAADSVHMSLNVDLRRDEV
jgi:hypothetical protein